MVVKDNISWVDSARGISILLIVLFHIVGQVFTPEYYMGGFLKTFRIVTYEGVDVFFFLSGFGLSLSLLRREQVNWGNWLKARFIRIVPLYWFVLFVFFIAFLLKAPLNITPTDHYLLDFLLHFSFLHTLNPATFFSINLAWWFLPIILMCYFLLIPTWKILVYFNFSASSQRRKISISILAVILTIIAVSNIVYGFTNPGIINGVIFFYLGVFSSVFFVYEEKYFQKIFANRYLLILSLLVVIIGLLFLFQNSDNFLVSLFLVIFICSLSSIASDFQTSRLILKKISMLSYPMYLIHWAFIMPIFHANRHFPMITIPYYLVFIFSFIVYFFVVIIISYLLFLIDNKIFQFRNKTSLPVL